MTLSKTHKTRLLQLTHMAWQMLANQKVEIEGEKPDGTRDWQQQYDVRLANISTAENDLRELYDACVEAWLEDLK